MSSPVKSAKSPRAPGSRLVPALGYVAVVLPLLVTIARATASGQWEGDLASVRDLGLVSVGLGGGVSTWLTQALTMLPLGPRELRAALGSALALGVASWLVYALAMRALSVAARMPRLAPVLAATAAVTVALSPSWQREATVGGGAMVGTALALGAIELTWRCLDRAAPGLARGGTARWLALGAAIGACLAESLASGLVALAAVAALVTMRRLGGRQTRALWPTRRVATTAAVIGALTLLYLVAPMLLRPMAPHAWVDLGRSLLLESLAAGATLPQVGGISAWLHDAGFVAVGLAAAGAVVLLWSRAGRPLAAPLIALIGVDALAHLLSVRLYGADLRALSVAALAIFTAVGVKAAVGALLRTRLPMMRPVTVLVVVFQLMNAALASEESSFVANPSERFAAEEWTDHALTMLGPRAAILVRQPELAFRLWSARVTRGDRPDVVVLPSALLGQGHVAASLARIDPAVDPLLRDFALKGEPSEYALTTLADRRPLYVELDTAWSKRLASHLAVDGLWLGYAPEPLGASDRAQASANLSPIARVLASATEGVIVDGRTVEVVSAALTAQASMLSILGDQKAAELFLARVADLTKTETLLEPGWLHEAFAAIAPKPLNLPREGRGKRRR